MIKAGNRKHPDDKENNCKYDGKRTDADKESQQAGKMKGDERQHPNNVKGSGTGVEVI